MNSQDIIEKIIEKGHLIASKIRGASSTSDVDVLSKEIEQYYDYVDNNVGKIDEFAENEERYSKLSFYLKIAVETKERHLRYPHKDTKNYGNEDVDVFEEYLDSKEWQKNDGKLLSTTCLKVGTAAVAQKIQRQALDFYSQPGGTGWN